LTPPDHSHLLYLPELIQLGKQQVGLVRPLLALALEQQVV
jgi:hypothetical protein